MLLKVTDSKQEQINLKELIDPISGIIGVYGMTKYYQLLLLYSYLLVAVKADDVASFKNIYQSLNECQVEVFNQEKVKDLNGMMQKLCL